MRRPVKIRQEIQKNPVVRFDSIDQKRVQGYRWILPAETQITDTSIRHRSTRMPVTIFQEIRRRPRRILSSESASRRLRLSLPQFWRRFRDIYQLRNIARHTDPRPAIIAERSQQTRGFLSSDSAPRWLGFSLYRRD